MSEETATSGGEPLLIAALIFVSSTPPETLTVIHGSSSWSRSNIAVNSRSSRPLQYAQTVTVTGCGDADAPPPVALGVGDDPPPAVHATPTAAAAITATRNLLRMDDPSLEG